MTTQQQRQQPDFAVWTEEGLAVLLPDGSRRVLRPLRHTEDGRAILRAREVREVGLLWGLSPTVDFVHVGEYPGGGSWVVVRAHGQDLHGVNITEVGEASPVNLGSDIGLQYPTCTALSRAYARFMAAAMRLDVYTDVEFTFGVANAGKESQPQAAPARASAPPAPRQQPAAPARASAPPAPRQQPAAPAAAAVQENDPGQFRLRSGTFSGKTLAEIFDSGERGQEYVSRLANLRDPKGGQVAAKAAAQAFLQRVAKGAA